MGEIQVWVNGIINTISGVDTSTTCKETVLALAQSYSLVGRFNLIEKTPTSERYLHPDEYPIKILQRWGEGTPNYFILRKKTDSCSPSTSRPSSASSQSSPSRTRMVHSSPPPVLSTDSVREDGSEKQKKVPPPVKPKPKMNPSLSGRTEKQKSKPIPLPRNKSLISPSPVVEEVLQKSEQRRAFQKPDLLMKDSEQFNQFSIPPNLERILGDSEETRNQERQAAEEHARKGAERQRLQEENKRLEEQRQRQIAEQQQALEEQRRVEQKKREEAREKALLEEKRLKEIELQRRLDEQRRKEEEEAREERRQQTLWEQKERKRKEQEQQEKEQKQQLDLQKKHAEEKKRLLEEKRKEEKRRHAEERKKVMEEEKRKVEMEKAQLEELVRAQECKINHQKSQLSGLDAAIQEMLKFESDTAIDTIQEEITNIEHSIQRNQAMLNEKEFWENELDLERQMHKKLEASLAVLKDKLIECNRIISKKREEISTLTKTIKKEEKKMTLNQEQADQVKAVKDELKELKREYKIITSNLEKVNVKLEDLNKEFQEKQKELKLVEDEYEKEKTKTLHIIIPEDKMEESTEGQEQKPGSPSAHRVLKGSPRQLASTTPSSENPAGIFL